MTDQPRSGDSTASADVAALSRVLGFWEVTASGVGIIVGAGIYVLVGAATAEAGANVWLAFVLAAALSALTGLSYCELASMYPKAGAEFAYAKHAFPGAVAFIVGWVMIAGLVVASGAVALGFGRYFREFIAIDERVAAIGLIAVTALIALGGIKNSARLTIVFSAIQVGGLLFVVVIGFNHVGDVNLFEGHGATGLLGASALVFFAFIGFDEVITLSEETRNASRTIPLALLAALVISAVLYVAVAIVGVSVLGAEGLAASKRPLADVMSRSLGGASVKTVSAVALVSTFNTTLLAITAASRLTWGMATDRALPRRFAALNRRHAPWLAVVVGALVAAAFASSGSLKVAAGLTDAAVYLVFLAVNGAVIVLRFREQESARPFRVPLAIGRVPLIPIMGIVATGVMLTQLEWRSLALGVGVVALGFIILWPIRRAQQS